MCDIEFKDLSQEEREELEKENADTEREIASDAVNGDDSPELDALRLYLDCARAKGRLTQEEIIELMKIIKNGTEREQEAAKSRMIESNLLLVVRFAKRYVRSGVQLDDLIQEGNIGLMKAIEKYDYQKDIKFSTYAAMWIKGAIIRYLNSDTTIRIPEDAHRQMKKIREATETLRTSLGRTPTPEEIAEALQLRVKRVYELIIADQPPVSMEAQVGEDAALIEMIRDENAPDPETLTVKERIAHTIRSGVSFLRTQREDYADVLELYFGLGDDNVCYTLDEIAERMNLTRGRVREMKVCALRILHNPVTIEKLRNI